MQTSPLDCPHHGWTHLPPVSHRSSFNICNGSPEKLGHDPSNRKHVEKTIHSNTSGWHRGLCRKPHQPEEAISTHLLHHHHPKRIVLVKNSDPAVRRSIILNRRNLRSFKMFLDEISELLHGHIRQVYTVDGRKIDSIQSLTHCPAVLVCVGHEPFQPPRSECFGTEKLPRLVARSHGDTECKLNGHSCSRSARNVAPAQKTLPLKLNPMSMGKTSLQAAESMDDGIEKKVHVNKDGSLSVEMKVHFRLLNEETLQWSTEIKKSSGTADNIFPDANGYYIQQECLESSSDVECEMCLSRFHHRKIRCSDCPHSCSQCKDHNVIKTAGDHIHHVKSSSSSASSHTFVQKKFSVESINARSSDEFTSFQHSVEELETTAEYHNISVSEKLAAEDKCSATDNTQTSDIDEHIHKVNVKITQATEDCDRPLSSVSNSSQVLQSLTEDQDEDNEPKLSIYSNNVNPEGGDEIKSSASSCYFSSSHTSPVSPMHLLSPQPKRNQSRTSIQSTQSLKSSKTEVLDVKESHCDRAESTTCIESVKSSEYSGKKTPESISQNIEDNEVNAGIGAKIEEGEGKRSIVSSACVNHTSQKGTEPEEGVVLFSHTSAPSRTSSLSQRAEEQLHQTGEKENYTEEDRVPSVLSLKSNDSAKSKKSRVSEKSEEKGVPGVTPESCHPEPKRAVNETGVRSLTPLSVKSGISSRSKTSRVSENPDVEMQKPEAIEKREPSVMSDVSTVTSRMSENKKDNRVASAMSTKSDASDKPETQIPVHEPGERTENERIPNALSVGSTRSRQSKSSQKSNVSINSGRSEKTCNERVEMMEDDAKIRTSSALSVKTDFSVTSNKSKQGKEDNRAFSVMSVNSYTSATSTNSKTENLTGKPGADQAIKELLLSPKSDKSKHSCRSGKAKSKRPSAKAKETKTEHEDSVGSTASIKSNISHRSRMSQTVQTITDEIHDDIADRATGVIPGNVSSRSQTSTASEILNLETIEGKDHEFQVRGNILMASVMSSASNASKTSGKSKLSQQDVDGDVEDLSNMSIKSRSSGRSTLSKRSNHVVKEAETLQCVNDVSESLDISANSQRSDNSDIISVDRVVKKSHRSKRTSPSHLHQSTSSPESGKSRFSSNKSAASSVRSKKTSTSAKTTKSCASHVSAAVLYNITNKGGNSVNESDGGLGKTSDDKNKSEDDVVQENERETEGTAAFTESKRNTKCGASERAFSASSFASVSITLMEDEAEESTKPKADTQTETGGIITGNLSVNMNKKHNTEGNLKERPQSNLSDASSYLQVKVQHVPVKNNGSVRSSKTSKSNKRVPQKDGEESQRPSPTDTSVVSQDCPTSPISIPRRGQIQSQSRTEHLPDLVPSNLPHTSPTEVVNEWLKTIQADSCVYESGEEFIRYDEAGEVQHNCAITLEDNVKDRLTNKANTDNEAEAGIMTEKGNLNMNDTFQQEKNDESGLQLQAKVDASEHNPVQDLPRTCHISVQVMKALVSPKLDRCNSLPEVSPVYGRKLSNSAQGLLDCLANLHLIDSIQPDLSSKDVKYNELITILHSLWLSDTAHNKVVKANDKEQASIDEECHPTSSSGVDVSSGSAGSGKDSINGGILQMQHTPLDAEHGIHDHDVLYKVEEESGENEDSLFDHVLDADRSDPATPDIAWRVQWSSDSQREGETINAQLKIDTPANPTNQNENYTTEIAEKGIQEDTASRTSSPSILRETASKTIPHDPDPVWVLNLLSKIEKQFMTHYLNAVAEFKARWNLSVSESKHLDFLIGDLKDNIHNRIQSSISRELQNIWHQSGWTPTPPIHPISRELTKQSEQRQGRLKVVYKNTTETPLPDTKNNTGTGINATSLRDFTVKTGSSSNLSSDPGELCICQDVIQEGGVPNEEAMKEYEDVEYVSEDKTAEDNLHNRRQTVEGKNMSDTYESTDKCKLNEDKIDEEDQASKDAKEECTQCEDQEEIMNANEEETAEEDVEEKDTDVHKDASGKNKDEISEEGDVVHTEMEKTTETEVECDTKDETCKSCDPETKQEIKNVESTDDVENEMNDSEMSNDEAAFQSNTGSESQSEQPACNADVYQPTQTVNNEMKKDVDFQCEDCECVDGDDVHSKDAGQDETYGDNVDEAASSDKSTEGESEKGEATEKNETTETETNADDEVEKSQRDSEVEKNIDSESEGEKVEDCESYEAEAQYDEKSANKREDGEDIPENNEESEDATDQDDELTESENSETEEVEKFVDDDVEMHQHGTESDISEGDETDDSETYKERNENDKAFGEEEIRGITESKQGDNAPEDLCIDDTENHIEVSEYKGEDEAEDDDIEDKELCCYDVDNTDEAETDEHEIINTKHYDVGVVQIDAETSNEDNRVGNQGDSAEAEDEAEDQEEGETDSAENSLAENEKPEENKTAAEETETSCDVAVNINPDYEDGAEADAEDSETEVEHPKPKCHSSKSEVKEETEV